MQQTPALSKCASLCASIIKHADIHEHQQVSIFTQNTHLNQSQRQKTYTFFFFHFSVCKQMWILLQWMKSQLYNVSCIILLKKGYRVRWLLLRFLRVQLSRMVMHLVMENFSLGLRWGWECVRSHHVTFSQSRWPAIGPEPNPLTLNLPPPPDTQQPSLLPDRCTYRQRAETSCVFVGRLSLFSVAFILRSFWHNIEGVWSLLPQQP